MGPPRERHMAKAERRRKAARRGRRLWEWGQVPPKTQQLLAC